MALVPNGYFAGETYLEELESSGNVSWKVWQRMPTAASWSVMSPRKSSSEPARLWGTNASDAIVNMIGKEGDL